MSKFKLTAVVALLVMMTGCFGGSVSEGKSTFTADGGTFNLLTLHMNITSKGLKLNADSKAIAESNVPAGGKITNVNTTPGWRSQAFPGFITGFFNEHIIGYTGTQIGGTK